MVETLRKPKDQVRIGIIGKYTDWKESYKSLAEALVHGGIANSSEVKIQYLDSNDLNQEKPEVLKSVDGILVPGGFGERGIEGKIRAIRYARENNIPFFGICLGMQLAVIEFARNVSGIKGANSSEFEPSGSSNVIDLMESQKNLKEMGGTMRLGAYKCGILSVQSGKTTRAYGAYGKEVVFERHRHRYEVANRYRSQLEESGMIVSGRHLDQDKGLDLVEMVELSGHPWYLGCQFHPEFVSQPMKPHPLFSKFIEASLKFSQSRRRS